MITMNELVDLRMQQQIANEIYRQQIMQRIPDPFPPMLPLAMSRHVILPPRVTLPGVEVTLQNDDLWKQFHHIGTEMIITKSGRRMFPSMRLSLSGLEDEQNYCVLLEMVPIGDCRYKFSGSQWVPAGGAEPQSPQRMFLHPDSPASGAHWQAQPILFSKVKLTNNTLDSSGHIVLASMHKYQPRIHIIRTADLAQIPWAPQQAFVFPETEFVAVTAYQNDRITKLKIDNNPFAKGFRETGQSRCKRKMSSSLSDDDQDGHTNTRSTVQQQQQRTSFEVSPTKCNTTNSATDSRASSICSDRGGASANGCADGDDIGGGNSALEGGPPLKRIRSNGFTHTPHSDGLLHDGCVGDHANSKNDHHSRTSSSTSVLCSPNYFNPYGGMAPSGPGVVGDVAATSVAFMHHLQQNMQTLLRPSIAHDLARLHFLGHRPASHGLLPTAPSSAIYEQHQQQQHQQQHQQQQQQQQQHLYHLPRHSIVDSTIADADLLIAASSQQPPQPPPPPTFQLPNESLMTTATFSAVNPIKNQQCSNSSTPSSLVEDATDEGAEPIATIDPNEIVVNVECCDIECESNSQFTHARTLPLPLPPIVDVASMESEVAGEARELPHRDESMVLTGSAATMRATDDLPQAPRRKAGFSISAILGSNT